MVIPQARQCCLYSCKAAMLPAGLTGACTPLGVGVGCHHLSLEPAVCGQHS
jgi:hypothetical protein